jgi:hypothetical protein
MTCLRVDIVAFVDESFPEFVRCAFADANGKRHTFIEKIPVVTTEDLWSDSIYPQQGTVPCEKVESSVGGPARGLARVTIGVGDSMDLPGYSEQFIVRESQLVTE